MRSPFENPAFRDELRAMVDASVANYLEHQPPTEGQDGTILPTTYSAEKGEVDVQLLESNNDDEPVVMRGVQLLTPLHAGRQAPRGGERVFVIRGHSGPRAILEQGTDDGMPVPSGETWLGHFSAKPQSDNSIPPVDAYVKITNDAKTQGDALAGLHILAGAFASIATAGGIALTLDDAAELAQLVVGTLGLAIDGNAGKIRVGKNGGTMSALITADDLNQTLTAWATHLQSGDGVAPPTIISSQDVSADD